MESLKNQLDEVEYKVLSELKDFQRATVERIDSLYRQKQNRVLVSDEVGLGKTLIARGTIAKFAKLREEEGDDLVKVVYICSNATIAQQNLEKLRISDKVRTENNDTSRLSMQHLNIFNQENDPDILNSYIQIIPLTPGTSFQITNSQGLVSERALIYAILKRVPELKEISRKLKSILAYGTKSWQWNVDFYENQFKQCNKLSKGKYEDYMVKEVSKRLKETPFENTNLLDALISFADRFKPKNGDLKFESRRYIIELRKIFSDISLDKLDPDLIIMDEFQRFKYLLSSDKGSDMERLASKFFNAEDLRILMLSATPYKMYSTLDELDEDLIDEHYSEFYNVMEFLKSSDNKLNEFKTVWSDYSTELKQLDKNNTSFIQIKNKAEDSLYENICRTERITESQLADFIDDSSIKTSLTVLNEDITSYIQLQKIIDDIGLNIKVPLDYVKSAPYLLSFMKNYALKRKIEKQLENYPDRVDLFNKKDLWLDETKIDNFKEIKPNHARLEKLMEYSLKDNAELLLWVPPTKPYYEPQGVYENINDFSKTLIFSSWEMVPRMISSLVSYEVERRTIGQVVEDNYFAKRRTPAPRMNFAFKEGKPTQMTLFTLIYASQFLANSYNPIDCSNKKLSLKEIKNELKNKIKEKLDKFEDYNSNEEGSKWYYLAPLLLDDDYQPGSVEYWFENVLNYINPNALDVKGFKGHIKHLEILFNQLKNKELKLGRRPDDLEDILADMAIAAPGNCIYRSFVKEAPEEVNTEEYRKCAIRVARMFITKMNSPQAIATIDLATEDISEEPYWKRLLIYCRNGNFQAMLDEYTHLLSNGIDKTNKYRVHIIREKLLEALELRATSYEFDTFKNFKAKINNENKFNYSLRTHFAVSFTKGKSDIRDTNRKKSVRDAFNSPFRPFVLASTSIGQEGLDFHNYCRRIVHWNLPSNPIDLEQREGRINRFECLAIRQNIAKRYGDIEFSKNVWSEMFDEAINQEKDKNCSDLIPFWGLTESEDMVKIERIVPMYPFSRDIAKYNRLINILSLYRLTLGQARQEELLDTIFKKDIEIEELQKLFINLSPYYKEKM